MDLSNNQSWQLIFSGNRQVDNRRVYASMVAYTRIPELRFRVVSPIISVNLSSESASPTWFLGAFANLYVPIRGGTYTVIDEPKRCKLNDETLLIFNQPTDQIPYSLSLKFPYWIEDITYQVWQYIDDSGQYYASTFLGKLSDLIEGQEITLVNVSYSQSTDDPNLVVSTFVEATKYERFEVGRFRYVGNAQTVSDPIIRVAPKQLTAIFTAKEKVLPNTIKVTVNPNG